MSEGIKQVAEIVKDKRYKLLRNCYAYVSENSGNVVVTIEGTHKYLTESDHKNLDVYIEKFEHEIMDYFKVPYPSYFIEIEH